MDLKISKRAFSTAEVLLALGLISIALLTVIGLFTSSFRLLNRTSDFTIATEIARDVIERSKLLGKDAPPPIDTTYDGTIPTDPEDSGFPPKPYPSVEREGIVFFITVEVAPAPDTLQAKVLTVWVRWNTDREITLQTYI